MKYFPTTNLQNPEGIAVPLHLLWLKFRTPYNPPLAGPRLDAQKLKRW